MKRVWISLLVLLCFATPLLSSWNDPAWDIPSDEELNRVIAQLQPAKTEMAALQKLINYASHTLYEGSLTLVSGDPQADQRRRAARNAVYTARSPGLVERALNHEDRAVRFWAVMSVQVDRHEGNPWNSLVPRLQQLAADDADASIRTQAIEQLRRTKDGAAFVDHLVETGKESNPSVLMTLLRFDSKEPSWRAQWYAQAVTFLEGNDATLRYLWLQVISGNACNPSTADMWRIEADPAMVEALQQVELSGTDAERKLAKSALMALIEGYRWGQRKKE